MTKFDADTPADPPREHASGKAKNARDRADRLEASLRANLLKRKAQSRIRTALKANDDPIRDP